MTSDEDLIIRKRYKSLSDIIQQVLKAMPSTTEEGSFAKHFILSKCYPKKKTKLSIV